MRVTVTASNAGGSAAAPSAPSARRHRGTTTEHLTAGPSRAPMRPARRSRAAPAPGKEPLRSATPTTGSGATPPGPSCANVSGATSTTYTLTSVDTGSTIRVDVSASNSAGSASATSQPTAPVASTGQSLTFSGTLNKNTSSLAFPVTIAVGEADATLTFSKGGTATVQLVDAGGAVVAKVSGGASPSKLNVPNLAAGSYRYVITCSGYKGSFSFTLAVKAPSP